MSTTITSFAKSLTGWLDRHSDQILVLFVILFLALGILTLNQFGLTWDEGLGNMFFGERYLHFFTSFQQSFLDFKWDMPALRQYPLHLFLSPFHDVPYEFPPVADTLSAGTMYVFSYWLGWLNPVDGFHLATILLSGVFLFCLYRFAAPRLGKLAAWMGVLLLATFPRFWADMHFNVKDIPETVFFGLTIMAFWTWYEKPAWWRALLSGLLFGCALGIKANALFIVPILGLTILPKSVKRADWSAFWLHIRRTYWQYGLMAVSAIVFYFVSWPNLYAHPIGNLTAYWDYIFSQGGRQGGPGWNLDPLRQAITTFPEVMLLLLGIGLVLVAIGAWKKSVSIWSLLLLWLILPVLRASVPEALNFDGIRHLVEFVPAAALIAGYAASRLVHWLSWERVTYQTASSAALVLILGINLGLIYSAQYPYLHIYYNSLTGGLVGAQQAGLTGGPVDYWGSSYRQGMDWVRLNAPQGARVHAMYANWILELSAPVFLRPDIQVIPYPLPDFSVLETSDQATYLFYLVDPHALKDELDYLRAHYQPVFELNIDATTLLQIYRLGRG